MRFAQRMPAGNYYLVISDQNSGNVFDWSNNTWVALGSATTPTKAMSEVDLGLGKNFYTDVDLSLLCANSTPRNVIVTMFQRAGSTPAISTDAQKSASFKTICCGYDVSGATGPNAFEVDVTINLTNTQGNSCHITAELRKNGKTVPLATLDSGATCALSVSMDASTTGGNRASQFTVNTSTVGAANTDSRFEVTYSNPGFAANRSFTCVATIVTGGVTYVGAAKFSTF